MKHRKNAVSWCVVATVACVLGMVSHNAAASGATGYLTTNGERIAFMHAYAIVEPNPYDETQENVVVILTDYPFSDEAIEDEWARDELVEEKWIRYVEIDIASDESKQWVQMFGMWLNPSGSSYQGQSGLGTLELKVFNETRVEGRYYTDGEEKGVAFDVTFQADIRRAGDAPHPDEISEDVDAQTTTDSAEIDKERVEAYLNRGKAALDARQADPAMEAFTKAIELDPAYAEAYLYRGWLYAQLGQIEEAMVDYTKVIELTPDNATVYNLRGLASGKLGQTDQEIADYTKAIELNPTFTTAYYNRGYVYAEMEQYDQALADYTKMVELEPENASVYATRGRLYAEMGQYDQALADYGKSIELAPDDVNAYYDRAETFFKMGKCDDVRQDIRQIHTLGYRPDLEFLTDLEGKCPTYVLELDDAEDDVENTNMDDDGPAKDMVKAVIESDGSNLYVTVTLKDDIAYYLEGHMAGVLINLHLDTDNDITTGGKGAWFDYLGCQDSWCDYLSGFEYLIRLMTCIAYDDGSEACIGASTSGKSTGFFSSYDTEQYAQGQSWTEDVHESLWESSREDITENIVKTVIPYAEIGVVSGQVIRIVIEEEDASAAEDANSWDYLVTLK